MSSYQGVALVSPISFGYQKQSPRSAAFFIGSVLRELITTSAIDKAEIDGLAVSSFSLGVDSSIALVEHFGLEVRWLEQINVGGVSGLLALRRAARAIEAGDAGIIACIGGDTAHHRGFEATAANFSSFSIDGAFPYGAGGPNAAFSLITANYMKRYGATREDFARICLDQRYNANHYPMALLGHKPLTLDAYLGARPIAGPVHLFDCVMPCAGGEGFLVMSTERARALQLPYAELRVADELHNAHRKDPVQDRSGWTTYIDDLYQQSGFGPEDMQFLQTYDDYPMISMMQMEDLGFCRKGEGPAFVQRTDMRFDGSGSAPGKLPHNTSGGQLSCGQAGSAAGYLGLTESIRQLTDRAGSNQILNVHRGLVSGYGMVNYDRGLCSAAAILSRGQS
ncbi:thiolase [Luminiphilus syltensis NOR5-1B]|uniref:Thiolase n=1 Tax=Luminiphilus syltensis NOR5-1B TaxID=565045 RepID=B8KTB6_9GAMM|nr:thiolase family protein [Luminiphilus syltensis]EED34164.1 thiolase [Luminiphilus syltensis NOR5-1B]